ncbi:MAG TPA: hypothetical protein VLA43_15930, partial [Longimicrobiales bacterium]|nr:hypothetical protein [Longimicrobiales bacterium]
QTLHVRLGRDQGDTLVTVELGRDPARISGVADASLRYVMPNGSGVEYGLFLLDDESLAYVVDHVATLEPALVRGTAWVTLWDQVLEQRLAPGRFLDVALAALPQEPVEQNVSRILGSAMAVYWDLLPAGERVARAPEVEGVLWEGSETLPGLPLSENDQTALATELALREVDGWQAVLQGQEDRIVNPDRKARFAFVRPSLDADPAVRAAFFASLADPANREREPWVLSGVGNLHHPLRAATALDFIRPALDMVEEIQRTGDIFFPGRWLDATLGGHGEVAAAETVQAFLADRPDLPPRLRGKVLQSADMVWRSAAILHGWGPS